MMTPAALSILTTSFTTKSERIKALGIWSATVPMASALGVTLGGVLSQGPGWRAVFLVNVPIAVARRRRRDATSRRRPQASP